MAAWLRTIVRGEELAVNDDGGGRDVPAEKGSSDNASTSTTDSKEKHPAVTEGMQEMRQPSAGGSSRRSHYGEAHNLTEKRRRHKINERLKTLQQLVPGCDDKSNQASTLDQTIQYLKSLQHHVQAMSIGPARPAAAAVPVVPPQYAPPGAPPVMPAAPVVLAASAQTTMVPFGAMLQTMPHYPAAVPVMMPAPAAPLSYSYPAAPPPRAAAVAPGGAGSSSASHRHGSSSRKGKGGRSLRHKH
ncbi:hypothetical protein PVAP13_3KG529900 [Panicum virgatum]|uniref:BHLH domain-containing protein n=1 Tax=Panicum virgatum TaxID=38727 RepID=A0A8T0VB31_PANVG|nr:hypothetical protein PVAP13_3KG529900 [Panicum virgatum]